MQNRGCGLQLLNPLWQQHCNGARAASDPMAAEISHLQPCSVALHTGLPLCVETESWPFGAAAQSTSKARDLHSPPAMLLWGKQYEGSLHWSHSAASGGGAGPVPETSLPFPRRNVSPQRGAAELCRLV